MTIKFRTNRVILMGDTHQYDTTQYLCKTRIPDSSDVIFLGDGGEGFASPQNDFTELNHLNNICRNKDISLYMIRGNHTNPDVWKRNLTFSNIFLVQDYTPAEFPNGVRALLVGGGLSIDRVYRTEGKDYWKDETTVYQKTSEKYDILFSHDAPDYFNHSTASLKTGGWSALAIADKNLITNSLIQRGTMSNIVEDIGATRIYSGHFHNSTQEESGGVRYRCLDINELLEINA